MSRMRVLLLVVLALVLTPLLVASAQEYRIGFVSAITGPASSLGVPERDVAVMIQKELEAKGGITGPDGKKYPVKIFVHDDESKVDTTKRLVKKLIAEDGVHVVIASSQSPTSLAVVPDATEGKVPLISMASSHAIVTPIKERFWVFKTPQSNIHVSAHQVRYLLAKRYTKIASLYVNDAFGEDSRRGLAATGARAPGRGLRRGRRSIARVGRASQCGSERRDGRALHRAQDRGQERLDRSVHFFFKRLHHVSLW